MEKIATIKINKDLASPLYIVRVAIFTSMVRGLGTSVRGLGT